MLLARPIIRLRFDRWYDGARLIDGGEYDAPPDQVAATAKAARQTRIDAACQQILGPILIVAGALLWGYGDMLGDWLFACCCR